MSTRLEELASLPWDEAQRQAFLTMQFAAQRHHYHTQYNDASFEVILCDGEPSGRLYVARWPEEIRIIDIALAPAYRGRGVGTALITSLLGEATRARKRVRLHVEPTNRALRLYQRLGFGVVAEHGLYLFMEWAPPVEAGA